jgi:hypothetical protein
MSIDYEITQKGLIAESARQGRICPVCSRPVADNQAHSINIGGGLELLCHGACLDGLVQETIPNITIPLSTNQSTANVALSGMALQKANSPRKATTAEIEGLAWLISHADPNGNIWFTEDSAGRLYNRHGNADSYEPMF